MFWFDWDWMPSIDHGPLYIGRGGFAPLRLVKYFQIYLWKLESEMASTQTDLDLS
jgi:hypothetical protein